MRQIKRLLPVLVVCAIAVCMAFATACSKKYTVTFDSDGGTTVASQTLKSGQKATEPDDPTKANYEFDGWYLGNDEYDFGTAVKSNITLKAHWTRLYTVTFDVDGGSPAPTAQTVRDGGKVTEPANPTKANYGFGGWALNGTAYNFSTATVTADITLTAIWNLNTYTVTFDTNGGSDIAAATVDHGAKVTAPTAPTKVGYTFDAWYVGETEYNFDTAVTGDITLTAHWIINVYDVTFNSNGGSEVEVQHVTYGETVTAPMTPVNSGNVLAGWCTDSELTNLYDFDTPVAESFTLYAKWTELNVNDTMAQNITINVDSVKKAYNIGDDIDTDGIILTVNVIKENGTTIVGELAMSDSRISIDTSAYDKTTAGTYTIYVSYTQGGITRYASYDVTVSSVISGVHGIELVKTVTNYNVRIGDAELVTVAVNDLSVYAVNDDGTLGSAITTGITYKYYLEDEEITAAEMTNANARVYQIWVYVEYTEGGELYVMSDFVLVTIVGNTIESATLKTGVTSIPQSYTATLGDDWVFTAKYSLTGDANIDLSELEVGTEAGQYTIEGIYTSVIGGGVAKVTYYYAVGAEIYSYEVEVPYAITPATVGGDFHALLDFGTADITDATHNIKFAPEDGDELVKNMVYSVGTPGYNETQNKKDEASNSVTLRGRIQLSATNGLALYLAGPATISVTAYKGGSSDATLQLYAEDKITLVKAADSSFTNASLYKTVTIDVEYGGKYYLFATASANTFSVEISGKVTPLQHSFNANDIDSEDIGTLASDYALDDIFTAKSTGNNALGAVDPSVFVGGIEFTQNVNLGGTGSATTRNITFTITEDMLAEGDVTLIVYAYHAGDVRVLQLIDTATSNAAATQERNVLGAGSIVQYTITKASTYYVRSKSSGQCVVYIGLSYDVAQEVA